MTDNVAIRDGNDAAAVAATQALGDGSQAPKVVLLQGDGTTTVVAPPSQAQMGPVNETAPASDTASSGLNGRLQRLAQRLTSLIALLPASLGQKNAAGSVSVALASDDAVVAVAGAQSGAAVTTDANGTLQQYLRGLVKLIAAGIGVVLSTSSNAGGIASTYRLLSAAASTNATSVKTSAGRIYQLVGYNVSTGVRYLKLYNKASAPTVGTDTPFKTIAIPPGQAFVIDNGDLGYYCSAGIAFAWTQAVTDADTTALAAGDIVAFNLDYV